MDTLKFLTAPGMPLRPSSFAGSKEQARKLQLHTKLYSQWTTLLRKPEWGSIFQNPAGEKFIACKVIAEGLLVLSSCWLTQTLHVFTTTFPLIFQRLASRARTQLSSSLQRLCANKGTLYLNCVWFPSWLEATLSFSVSFQWLSSARCPCSLEQVRANWWATSHQCFHFTRSVGGIAHKDWHLLGWCLTPSSTRLSHLDQAKKV